MMPYSLTPEAYQDLSDVLTYFSERSAQAAEKLAVNMRHGFELLAEFPDAGRARPEFTQAPVLFWPVGTYFIVYWLKDHQIEVLAILHTSRNLPGLLADRFSEESL